MTCKIYPPTHSDYVNMHDQCVKKWMQKMHRKNECVSYLAGISSKSCSSSELGVACDNLASRFTVDHASQLCMNLQKAHNDFWPDFLNTR